MIRNVNVVLHGTPFETNSKGVELTLDKYTGNNGCYACVTPNDEGRKLLADMVDKIQKEDDFDSDKLHITVMYSLDPVSFFYQPCPDSDIFDVKVSKIDTMVGHKGQTVVFAEADCEKLHKEHAKLKEFGARHTYDPYKSHITLHVFDEDEWEAKKEEVSKRIESMNMELMTQGGLSIPFANFKIANLKD